MFVEWSGLQKKWRWGRLPPQKHAPQLRSDVQFVPINLLVHRSDNAASQYLVTEIESNQNLTSYNTFTSIAVCILIFKHLLDHHFIIGLIINAPMNLLDQTECCSLLGLSFKVLLRLFKHESVFVLQCWSLLVATWSRHHIDCEVHFFTLLNHSWDSLHSRFKAYPTMHCCILT